MHFSIRWKLIFSLAIPLLSIFAVSLLVDWYMMRQNAMDDARADLRIETVGFADRLDQRFDYIELLAQSAAEAMEARRPTPEQMRALLRTSLDRSNLIDEIVLVVEPEFVNRSQRIALQLIREGDGEIRARRLDTDQAFLAEQNFWYHQVKARNEGLWTEAHRDPLLDDVPVVTYAMPFYREQRFAGVVGMTVRLSKIQQVLTWATDTLDSFAIVDESYRFVSHPNAELLLDHGLEPMMRSLDQGRMRNRFAAAAMDDAEVLTLSPRNAPQKAGFGPQPQQHFWLALAPIKSTNWLLVTAVPVDRAMAAVMDGVYRRAAFGLVMLGLVFAMVAIISIRVIRPIEQIANAVDEVAAGNLNVQVKSKTSRDEVGRLANGFNAMVSQIKKQIAALTRETSARERVESELRVARDIQTSLLPRAFPPFPDRHEFALHAVNLPAKQVAGDFFDYFFTSDGTLTLVIADVSGKGVPAAMLMAVTRTLIRNRATSGHTPSEIVSHTNELLYEDNQGTMFVTMFLCQYEPVTGRMVYVNAGHPPPYRFKAGEEPRPFGEITAPLVGACETGVMGEFEQAEEFLQPGETVVMFTDGVTEARSPEDKMLQEAGLVEVLRRHTDKTVGPLCDEIVTAVNRFQNDHPIDDVTVVALHCCDENATQPS